MVTIPASLDVFHVILSLAVAFLSWRLSNASSTGFSWSAFVSPGGWLSHIIQLGQGAGSVFSSPTLKAVWQAILKSLGSTPVPPVPSPAPAPVNGGDQLSAELQALLQRLLKAELDKVAANSKNNVAP